MRRRKRNLPAPTSLWGKVLPPSPPGRTHPVARPDVNKRAGLLEGPRVPHIESQPQTGDPLDGLTERQTLACALRFYGDSSGPLPLKLIGLRMGIKRAAVCRLIARGAARIRANGYDIALNARAFQVAA